MSSEVAGKADFTGIRYAQCWEDADVLLEALDIREGDFCVSIASAGDNALAMLARSPAKVIAVDLSPAQLACLHLRVAAYRELDHGGLLELIGSRPNDDRGRLYQKCRGSLPAEVVEFWDERPEVIEAGIGGGGKFENYFRAFRERALPWVHSRARVAELLLSRDRAGREDFYQTRWNSWRWRMLFRIFFSRFVMGRLGRDPSFFAYVEGSVADRILGRVRHALTELEPCENPYLHWILKGDHGEALPFALREENFEPIRANLDRLEIRLGAVEDVLDDVGLNAVDCYNLSDIFEYMSEDNFHTLLRRLVASGKPGARLAYWNMLAPRSRPDSMDGLLKSHAERASALHQKDKAFFYSRFVLEEVVGR